MVRAQDRVLELDELAELVQREKAAGRVVAHCHGCFDIFHAGHLKHLEAARTLADVLIVTVTPDRFVNKGPDRPVFPEARRAEVLAGLRAVDAVGVNRWPSAVDTIRLLRPSLFVKGQEYETPEQQVNPNFEAERRAIREVGGEVAFTHEWTSSSTAAFKKLQGSTIVG